MQNQSPIVFRFGSDATYQNITKDENTIYFITDNNGNHRLYVGETCYNVGIITDLTSGGYDNKKVPSSKAVIDALNTKTDQCGLVNSLETSLPNTLLLENNTEYRYFNLSPAAESLTVSIPNIATTNLYYSSVVLYKINCTDTVADFVTSSDPTNKPITFLNGDINLAESDTIELLFFSNGRDICCIAGVSMHDTV